MDQRPRRKTPWQGIRGAALVLLLAASAEAMAPGEVAEEGNRAPRVEPAERAAASTRPAPAAFAGTRSFIVAGRSSREVAERVEGAGGKVTHDLSIIRAVAAELTPRQLEKLRRSEPELKIRINRVVEIDEDAESPSFPAAE